MQPLDPIKEAQAAASLRESLKSLAAGDDDALYLDMIEGETGLFEAIDRLLVGIAEDLALAAGAKAAAAEIVSRSERFTKRAQTTRSVIEQAMMVAEIEKLERPTGTLSLVRRAAVAEITDEADIPTEFWKPGEPKLDRKGLLEALRGGRAIPGAALSNCAPSLTIRTK